MSGGDSNTAQGDASAIGGGEDNSIGANGDWATIPGGRDNAADGNYSFAAGRRAKAYHQGAFVWADSTDADFASTGDDQFMVRASGGVTMQTNGAGLWFYGDVTLGDGDTLYADKVSSLDDPLELQTNDTTHVTITTAGRVGIGTTPASTVTLDVAGNVKASGTMYASAFSSLSPLLLQTSGTTRITVTNEGNVGIGMNPAPTATLDVSGTARVHELVISGGADLAEPFAIVGAENVKPGMVVAIDPQHPGQLRIADRAYDRTVAGCVSGAGGLNPGLTMEHEGTAAKGSFPVALSGRVYCWADASYGPIQPGDLLTTSDTPGHVMKVTDYERAHGAIIGKAMSSLDRGRGLILVLVALQ